MQLMGKAQKYCCYVEMYGEHLVCAFIHILVFMFKHYKHKTKAWLVLCFWLSLTTSSSLFSQSNKTLWYNQPAKHFEETLVLGNGKMGASIFGGVATDSIYLNDATLWSGEPVNPKMNPEAYKNIPLIHLKTFRSIG